MYIPIAVVSFLSFSSSGTANHTSSLDPTMSWSRFLIGKAPSKDLFRSGSDKGTYIWESNANYREEKGLKKRWFTDRACWEECWSPYSWWRHNWQITREEKKRKVNSMY